jgi:HNH endonuclease
MPIAPGYRASNCGRMSSARNPNGSGLGLKTRILTGCVDSLGYRKHRFAGTAGKAVQTHAHRIVALLFIGPPPTPAHEVCHWDGNGLNNMMTNLRWGTAVDNAADRSRHGTAISGERAGVSVLTSEQVIEITRGHGAGESRSELATRFGVTQENVSQILLGRTWAKVTGLRAAPRVPKIILNPEKVLEVVRLRRAKVGQRIVADRFGVSLAAIKAIMSGRAWSEVTGIPRPSR